MILRVLMIAIVILVIYSVILTYLYRKKSKDKGSDVPKSKVDKKISDIRGRLEHIKTRRYPVKINLEEERK